LSSHPTGRRPPLSPTCALAAQVYTSINDLTGSPRKRTCPRSQWGCSVHSLVTEHCPQQDAIRQSQPAPIPNQREQRRVFGCRQAVTLGLGPTLGPCRQLPSYPTVQRPPGMVMRVRPDALIGRSWGMLMSTMGSLPTATAEAAAPPRRQTVTPRPPVDRDTRRM
jgi:hypothetical protein